MGVGGLGFTEMSSGSEAGSYLRLIDFVYHSTLGLRVIKKKVGGVGFRASSAAAFSFPRLTYGWCLVFGVWDWK